MWEAVVEHGARGDRAADDRLSLAIALGSSGKRAEALEQLRDVWRRDPASSIGRYAFARIEALEAAIANPAEAPRKALTFPSTHQKHNYCGPAVLELCLRSLGIEIFQEEIASTVKGEHGTPMFAIVRYLHDNGVVARRIAATATRLKSAIDLGLPVILQEEYSTTSHVAVLTGYDAGLGLFITSDPTTHRPTYKSFSWTEQAGELFGNGAVVVLGRVGPEAECMAEKCDAAGLVDEPHLAILDECDQRQAPGPLAGAEDAALHEVLLLAQRAIEIEPTFKLAWYRRWRALQGLHDRRRADETRSQLLETLFEIRTRFPGDEWPFQLHANWLMSGERFDEAFVQYMEASARDPEDANNVMDMGYCRALAGDLAASEKHLLRSLRLSAASPDTHVRLADVYLRQLEDDDAELSAADQRSRLVRDTTMVEHRIERSVEEVSRRSGHFAALATELSPRDAYGHEVLGVLALRAQRWADAMAAFEKAAELAPGRLRSRRGLALACERMGDVARAEQLFTELCAAPDADAASWLSFAELLTRQDKREEAIAALSKGLLALEGQRRELVEPLFDLLREHESTEIAAAKLRDLSTRRPSDAAFQRTVAATLDGAGQRGHAVAVYRQSLAAAPTDLMTAFRLGKALSLSLATRDEALALLERVVELAPGWPHGCRELALLLADSDPERALAVLAPVLDSEEPYTLEAHGVVLEKLGRIEEARRAYQRAIHANTEPATALIAYCDWHAYAHRFDRAVAIARTLVDADGNATVEEALGERAQDSWLTAHRLAGRMTDALPAVLALVSRNGEKVPLHLAHEVYWGTRTPRTDLAARAAAALREAADDA